MGSSASIPELTDSEQSMSEPCSIHSSALDYFDEEGSGIGSDTRIFVDDYIAHRSRMDITEYPSPDNECMDVFQAEVADGHERCRVWVMNELQEVQCGVNLDEDPIAPAEQVVGSGSYCIEEKFGESSITPAEQAVGVGGHCIEEKFGESSIKPAEQATGVDSNYIEEKLGESDDHRF